MTSCRVSVVASFAVIALSLVHSFGSRPFSLPAHLAGCACRRSVAHVITAPLTRGRTRRDPYPLLEAIYVRWMTPSRDTAYNGHPKNRRGQSQRCGGSDLELVETGARAEPRAPQRCIRPISPTAQTWADFRGARILVHSDFSSRLAGADTLCHNTTVAAPVCLLAGGCTDVAVIFSAWSWRV